MQERPLGQAELEEQVIGPQRPAWHASPVGHGVAHAPASATGFEEQAASSAATVSHPLICPGVYHACGKLTAVRLALLLLSLAAPAGERHYRVFVDGVEDGAAFLSIRPLPRGRLAYAWRSQIGLSARPCLRSEQRVSGVYAPGQPVPDELAFSLGPRPPGSAATLGPDGLPDHVQVQGVVYQAAPARDVRWDRCWPHGPSDGIAVRLPAEAPDPRQLARATFTFAGLPPRESRRFDGTLPDDVALAIDDAHRRAGSNDCKAVARRLEGTLRARGYEAHVEGGLLLDRGRLWPHAWTQVRLDGRFRDVDATTGSGWADAGRVDVGPLEGPAGWQTGLALLRLLGARPALAGFGGK
jgi:hypothetical protein